MLLSILYFCITFKTFVSADETKSSDQPVVRKRRWGSCKSIKKPVLCISSDPLKVRFIFAIADLFCLCFIISNLSCDNLQNLIPDAKPVAESEVHLPLEEEDAENEEERSKLDRAKERIVVGPVPPPNVSSHETTRIVVNTSAEAEGLLSL